MSTVFISLLLALGGSVWIFSKVQRSTGGADPKQSALFGAIAGVILFLFMFIVLGMLPE